ncbi:hypothetical protein CMUS01_12848 [Colletotrichum musicola]|uniref:Uncharacterized protein n=1 Tax=Colletotrichum musicola TaxID=2175873 RepID=A0A8H6JI43_9PEZI|nr:hypothetical protein CMUS01_12848 [Colletotrichum musicola]
MSSPANASAPVFTAQAQDNSSSEQPSKRQKTDREETDDFAAFLRELDAAAAPCWLFPPEEFAPVDTTREGGNANSQGSNIGPSGGAPNLLEGDSSFLNFLGDGINFDYDVLEGASEPSKDYWNREQQPAPVSANPLEALAYGSGSGIDNDLGTPPSVGPAVQSLAPFSPNTRKRAFEKYWEGPLGNLDGLEGLPSQEGQSLPFQQQGPEALAGPSNPPADPFAAHPRLFGSPTFEGGVPPQDQWVQGGNTTAMPMNGYTKAGPVAAVSARTYGPMATPAIPFAGAATPNAMGGVYRSPQGYQWGNTAAMPMTGAGNTNLGVYKAGGMESGAYQRAHPGSYLANVAPAVPFGVPFGGPAAHFAAAAAAPVAPAPVPAVAAAPAAVRPGPAKRGRSPKANAAPRRAVRPATSPAVSSEAGRLIVSGLHYTVLGDRVTSLKSSSKKWEGIGPETKRKLTSAVRDINDAERKLKKSHIKATAVGFNNPVSISGQLLDNLADLVAALGSNEWTDLGVNQQKLASQVDGIQEAIADLREGREVPVVAGPS